MRDSKTPDACVLFVTPASWGVFFRCLVDEEND
ncbi:DUF397 domain-containing protein [Actinomadura gamaensis]|uniref:DUF397 domain-containing protein n=1 Tax=Actinomadura gamaensis TaxID=1763541 RepID=A0ABV9U814_9ACTN